MTFISAGILKEKTDTDLGIKFTSTNGVTQISELDPEGLFAVHNPQLKSKMRVLFVNNVSCEGKSPSEVEEMMKAAEGIMTLVADDEPETSFLVTADESIEKPLQEGKCSFSILLSSLLSSVGWTPDLWKNLEQGKNHWVAVLFFLFLVDVVDAVFDLILAITAIMYGSSNETSFGIVLLIMTILGRVISGLYGWSITVNPPSEVYTFFTFAWMEVTVCSLEDGAAILLLANSTGDLDMIEKSSMYLTIICGLIYIGYFIFDWGSVILNEDKDCSITLTVLPAASASFQIYILVTQVMMSNEDDAPLSGTLKFAAVIVYGVTALVLGGFTIYAFISDGLMRVN